MDRKRKHMKIRTQMLISFTAVVAITLFMMTLFSSIMVEEAVNEVTSTNLDLSQSVLTSAGEALVIKQARAAAHELAYLMHGKDIKDYKVLRADNVLRAVATQDILTDYGKSGYIDVYDDKGVAVLHPNEKVEGRNFKEWADKYPDMWQLVERSFSVPESSGYYSFLDTQNRPRKKFMSMIHIPGTNFIVVAAVYIDAYFAPVHKLIQTSAENTSANALNKVWNILLVGFVLAIILGLCGAAWLSLRLTRPINELVQGVSAVGQGDFQVKVSGTGSAEIGELAEAFNNLGHELTGYMRRLEAEAAARQAVASEMQIARQIQESLLPSTFPPFPEKRHMQLYAVNQPAKEVAGDFYDFFLVGNSLLALVMGDVSGKGVPAALFMTMTRTLLRNICPDEPDPAKALARANDLLCQDNDASMFVTLFLAYYNIDTGQMLFANAGHNDPYIVSATGQVARFGRMGDIALGAMSGLSYTSDTISLGVDDCLVLYTDGITEAPSPENEEYGEPRFERFLADRVGQPLKDICNEVVEDVNKFQNDERFDDVTIMLVRRRENNIEEIDKYDDGGK